jgi:hypothetical protein
VHSHQPARRFRFPVAVPAEAVYNINIRREASPMKVVGAIFILNALLIGAVPQFTNCSVQGRAIEIPGGRTVPMKCHWTANAAPTVAAPLLLTGVMLLLGRSRETRRGLSVLGSLLGVCAILLPTWLIGVCANNEMMCKLVMQPTMVFCGIVSGVAGLVGVVLAGKVSTADMR